MQHAWRGFIPGQNGHEKCQNRSIPPFISLFDDVAFTNPSPSLHAAGQGARSRGAACAEACKESSPAASAKPSLQPAKASPVAFVLTILEAYRRKGKSSVQALEHAHITPADWRNPNGCITALQMERLSTHAMRDLDDEALGWLSRPLPWGSYGLLARASISAPNLRVALTRWCRHHNLLTQDLALQVQVHKQGARKVVTVSVQEHFAAEPDQRRMGLLTLLRNVHGFSCWLLDSQIPLLGVDLPFAAPAYATQVGLMFPGPIRYGAQRACLHFDAHYLDMPVRRDETALNHMLQRALLVVVKPYRRDRLTQQRVRQLLSQGEGSLQTAESLAQELHMSVRSLHRFLHEDGTSLQRIKDEVRSERACQLLVRTRHPVKKIAGMTGFDNAKSFTRAFTRWTGLSPTQYRQQHGAVQPE
ncbi:AraC family transcriptional regulator [Allofranklinella schreckenbergeri]|uniref:AraC family transcriptional regulator n=1 Tax=Allofranklinella schreckenbergeri TaxID=1076744 RepID=A0A3M6QC97_9BURK|nr:AraC family transcriptional regulator [Allofranklinella schreckenbergeri]